MQKLISEYPQVQAAPHKIPVSPPFRDRRLHELDSIRGLASMTVVLLHFHEIWMPDNPAILSPENRIALSILRPFYSGSEAVILFFILSGLVLSLPYLSGRKQPYRKYLLRRTLRVYGPYLATIPLSTLGYAIWHHHAYHGAWAQTPWSHPLTLLVLLQHITFVGVYDWRQIDFVIWSLIQEMRISIIFPVLMSIVMRIGSRSAVLLAMACSAISLWVIPQVPDLSAHYSLGITIHYMAFFLIGIIVASQFVTIERWWTRLPLPVRVLLAVLSLFAYTYAGSLATNLLRTVRHGRLPGLGSILILANWISAAGAIGLMIVGLHAVKVRRILAILPVRFLGKISYSLYLIHPLVLLAITFSCANRISMWVQFPIYIAAAILIAWLFNLAVEQPFTRLSRSV